MKNETVEELAHVFVLTKKVTTDWNGRIEAIKRVVELSKIEDVVEFSAALYVIYPCFIAQLKDLRSKVVIEVCESIGELADELGIYFDRIGERLYPQLEKTLCNKKDVFSKPANNAIQSILEHTESNTILQLIIKSTSHRSSSVRCYSYSNIEYYITKLVDKQTILRKSSNFLSILGNGFEDSNSDVRDVCTSLFWSLYRIIPEESKSFYDSLTSSKQDRILQSRPDDIEPFPQKQSLVIEDYETF